VSKDKRLGRGLEALLGQLSGWNGPAAPAQNPSTSPAASPVAPETPDPYGGAATGPYIASSTPQPAEPVYGAPASVDALTEDDAPPSHSTGIASGTLGPPSHSTGIASGTLAPPSHSTGIARGTPAAELPARLRVDQIQGNPSQPRQDFDPRDLNALAESIRAHGLLQPVVVRRVEDHYELVAGERRLRAAKQAGWSEVPVSIVEADDRQTAELAIVENLQRKDLNALEKAASFQRYLEEYGCTQEELAGRLNLDRSTIANLIRLLELPQPVQDAVRRGKITQGHARALLPLGEEREQVEFCQRIQREGINVRQTEALVQEMIAVADEEPLAVIGHTGLPAHPRRRQNGQVAALEQEFRAALGLRVKISQAAKGRGKLLIHFDNHDEFEQLRQHICEAGPPLPQSRAG
jgi:ParB family transcriptional regulator, chromosome partitioning protein